MTKNHKKKYQKYEKIQENYSLEKSETFNQPPSSKILGLNMEEFPELKTSSSSHIERIDSQFSRSRLPKEKSLVSVVNKNSLKNLNEEFLTSYNSKDKIRNDSNFRNEKNDGGLLPTANHGNFILEKVAVNEAQISSESEVSKPGPKKVIHQCRRNPYKKKRSDPVVIDFENIFTVHQNLHKAKKSNIFKSKSQKHKNKEVFCGNFLDSSNPKRSRGKHREVQKKKLSKLKLAIIKERIIKQKIKESATDDSECFHLIKTLDFKTEIEHYVAKLNKRKSTKSESANDVKQIINIGKTQETDKDEFGVKREIAVREQKKRKFHQIPSGGELKYTSKFREYCDNVLTPSLNSSVNELIRELVKLQDRAHARDPIKAKAKRRHVSGMREVNKYLTLKKVKLIVIAPNLEKMQMEGGVYDFINDIKSTADVQCVPYAFALDRYSLGKCTKKNVPVSALAVLNYEGVEELFENTLRYLKEAKEIFSELSKREEKKEKEKEKEDVNARVISSLISVFKEELHLGDSKDNIQSETE